MDVTAPPVVVVGGGIAGLAAAYRLGGEGHDVVLLEATARVGGKLRAAEVAGVRVDVGAESMLARRPEGVELARELGLPVVHPTGASPRVWTRGALRPLPRSVMGVPADLRALEESGILSRGGLVEVRADRVLPVETGGDVSVATLVGSRLGRELVDRLVEPLLGGVYAGRPDQLSARATVPQLVQLSARGGLVAGVAELAVAEGPVFAGVSGGLARLPETLAASGRFAVRTGTVVREVRRSPDGFTLVTGSAADPEPMAANHLVLATPPASTARLLRQVCPSAAAELARIESASVAVVSLAHDASATAGVPALQGEVSGFLVPAVDGRAVKAATFSTAKWDWLASEAGGLVLLRVSVGRHREESTLRVSDDDLVARCRADLAEATGLAAAPVDTHVQRWGGGLPQYAVGHPDLVDRVRAALAGSGAGPGSGVLAVCGAAYDGVGIPAVIASAQRAADLIPAPGTMGA